MKKLDLKKLGQKLKEEISAFSNISGVTISGLLWEERIVNALKSMDLDPKWKMGSHRPGTDIEINSLKFSAKSQKIDGEVFLFSSFRTTKLKTLKEKIYYIDNPGKNFTHYLILSHEDFKDKIIYRVFLIEANFIKASDFSWKEKMGKTARTSGRLMGWETNYKNGIKLKITKNMSDQLWIYIDKKELDSHKKVIKLCQVVVKKDKIGSKWLKHKKQLLED